MKVTELRRTLSYAAKVLTNCSLLINSGTRRYICLVIMSLAPVISPSNGHCAVRCLQQTHSPILALTNSLFRVGMQYLGGTSAVSSYSVCFTVDN